MTAAVVWTLRQRVLQLERQPLRRKRVVKLYEQRCGVDRVACQHWWQRNAYFGVLDGEVKNPTSPQLLHSLKPGRSQW